MNERSYLSIGDVLALLREEFPDITISKIRFLESRGLLVPERTPSGYRKFYDHDVDRLRWILRQQRENFLPLKVIKGRLEGQEPGSEATPLFEVAETEAPDLEPVFAGQTVNGAAGRSEEGAGAGHSPNSRGGGQATALADVGAGSSVGRAMREGPRPRLATAVDGLDEASDLQEAGISGPTGTPTSASRQGRTGPPGETATPDGAEGSPGGAHVAGGVASRGGHSAVTKAAAAAAHPTVASAQAQAPADLGHASRPALGARQQPAPGTSSPSARATSSERPAATSSERPAATSSAGAPATSSGAAPDPSAAAVPVASAVKAPSSDTSSAADVAALAGASLTAAEMAQASGLELRQVEELESYGLIESRLIAGAQCFDEDALIVAKLAASFGRFGVEARHLRLFKHAAERQASLYSQVVMPLLRQRNPDARRRAHDDLTRLSELGASLQTCFTKAVLRDLTRG